MSNDMEKLVQAHNKATLGSDIFKDPPGYKGTLIPLDQGQSLSQLVKAALQNIDRFDTSPEQSERDRRAFGPRPTPRQQFLLWLRKQGSDVIQLAKMRPLNKIYRVKGGLLSETRGISPLGLIISYKKGAAGDPPLCGVQILGFKGDQLGSGSNPLPVPAEGLEDVTAACRDGSLPELRIDR